MTAGNANHPELPVVGALRRLSVFSAEQAGAYREHYKELAAILGDDVETKLHRYVKAWATGGRPGIVILTGNAGTGKTAIAEAYCRALGTSLPEEDELLEVAVGRWLVKDLSGLPDPSSRASAVRQVLGASQQQALVCANEGVLRDACADLDDQRLADALEIALRSGAVSTGPLTVVNLNRQRPTGDRLWSRLLDYLTREELWPGCDGCPLTAAGCPMRSNAHQLRRPEVREQLRTLVRFSAGEAVPTLRELLAIISWAIVGNDTCDLVRTQNRNHAYAFTAATGYFTRLLGGGLQHESIERSPLMAGLKRSGLGQVSDLEVDGWLRDTTGASQTVRQLAGDPQSHPSSASHDGAHKRSALAGSSSPLDRVLTKQGPMTFYALGEMVSTAEDPIRVEDGLDALVVGDQGVNEPAQTLWRQRVFFEAATELGGVRQATTRLLEYRHLQDLMDLADKASERQDTIIELTELVKGLNFLVTGCASAGEGLIVPDPACLFARDPGSFRPARPSLVHSQLNLDRLAVKVPDMGLVEQLMDVDHIDVNLVVDGDPRFTLRIKPRMYEAIREAAEFQGPVGQGVAEMNDLRGFYGRLASERMGDGGFRVADPNIQDAGLVRITLPHVTGEKVG